LHIKLLNTRLMSWIERQGALHTGMLVFVRDAVV
jgi:hypothetical protein